MTKRHSTNTAVKYSAVHCRLETAEKPSRSGQPVPMVHVDYTTKSGAERLDALLPKEEAERLKKTPFAAIQVSA